MIDFIIYDNDGNILRTGKCPQSILYMQPKDGESIIQGMASDDKHMIVNGEVVDKPVDNSVDMVQVRQKRNRMLSQTDWTQVSDAPLSTEEKSKWATYRQQLRDLPSFYSTETNMSNVVFPEEP